MNPENKEIEGHGPESVNQTINEEQSDEPKIKFRRIKVSQSPLKKGVIFKFGGVAYEVYDFKERGARSFVRMLGVPEYEEEVSHE